MLGNHDAHVLKIGRGGEGKKHHEQVAKTLTDADWRYLEAMPLVLKLEKLETVVVHGGLMPGVALDKQDQDTVINMRSFDADGKPSKRIEGGVPWASRWPGPLHARVRARRGARAAAMAARDGPRHRLLLRAQAHRAGAPGAPARLSLGTQGVDRRGARMMRGWILCVCVGASGCVALASEPPANDAGTDDAGTLVPSDAGTDAGGEDAGTFDAGSGDSGFVDAGSIDAGSVDAGTLDSGMTDAGLEPMPVISRNVPAHASSGTASDANDDDYDTIWRSSETTSAATPSWLAYDLSGVPAAHRGAQCWSPGTARTAATPTTTTPRRTR